MKHFSQSVIDHWHLFLCVGSVLSPLSSSADGRACALQALDNTCTQLMAFRALSVRLHLYISLCASQLSETRCIFHVYFRTIANLVKLLLFVVVNPMAVQWLFDGIRQHFYTVQWQSVTFHSTCIYFGGDCQDWSQSHRSMLCNYSRHTAIIMVRASF